MFLNDVAYNAKKDFKGYELVIFLFIIINIFYREMVLNVQMKVRYLPGPRYVSTLAITEF